MTFKTAFNFSNGWETQWGKKLYSDDPDDPGGETKYGITKRDYPELDIKNLTIEQAMAVLNKDYWLAYKSDQLPWPLGWAHFDCCVNVGNKSRRKDGSINVHNRANKILQRAVKTDDDGIVGNITLKKAANFKGGNLSAIRDVIERVIYYRQLADKRPIFKKYINGWQNRTDDLIKNIMID